MSWYRAGSVTVAAGSNVVTGAGTDFVANVSIGDAFIGQDGRSYEVGQIVSATDLRLTAPYQGAGGGGQAYAIQPTQSFVRDLALSAAALLGTFAAVRDGVGQGLFPDGSSAAPGLRFAADQDTGVTRLGDNILALVAGGVARLTADLNGATIRGAYCNVTADEFPQHIVSRSGVGSWRMGGLTAGNNSWALQFNASPLVTVDISGNFLVGVTSGGSHTIARGNAAGDLILNVSGLTQGSTQFFAGGGAGPSGAAAVMKAGTNPTTGRSIAAGGTINASGADYAEYMLKAAGCGVIAKGDVCGVDRDGCLTRTWADSYSYVIKSTEPGYTAGDIWAKTPKPDAPTVSAPAEPTAPTPPVSALPIAPTRQDGESDNAFAQRLAEYIVAAGAYQQAIAAYDSALSAYSVAAAAYPAAKAAYDSEMARYDEALAAWKVIHEAERATVDRIAFSGQVPCNVTGDFEVGDYIVAAADGAGIKAVAMKLDDMTMAQYARRIGKVWAIRDGRAWIDVQHG